jgi:hypothetical protein
MRGRFAFRQMRISAALRIDAAETFLLGTYGFAATRTLRWMATVSTENYTCKLRRARHTHAAL